MAAALIEGHACDGLSEPGGASTPPAARATPGGNGRESGSAQQVPFLPALPFKPTPLAARLGASAGGFHPPTHGLFAVPSAEYVHEEKHQMGENWRDGLRTGMGDGAGTGRLRGENDGSRRADAENRKSVV